MDAPSWLLPAFLGAVALVLVLLGLRPLLGKLARRNIGRRKARGAIVVAGLLVGTAIIASSLVVGDTLRYIFLQDVYQRLDAIDELVTNTTGGTTFSFPESWYSALGANLTSIGAPVDGLAPMILKTMPVRNEAGNKGNQAVTVMGLNASLEGPFGSLRTLDGRTVDIDGLPPSGSFLNALAASDLNATSGQDLTLFYGTTNQTLVHVTVTAVVQDVGKAGYERDPIIFLDLRQAQVAFREAGRIDAIKVSNRGGVADGAAASAEVTADLRRFIDRQSWPLSVDPVKEDGIEEAIAAGERATELFLVMGAFSVLAGVLLIVNIFVMLAEERKREMGVVRAIGFRRRELLATFALEGSFYAIVAAALGAVAGLGLGYAMIWIFDRFVPHGDIAVTFYFDPGSLLVAFVAGAALTWATILLASWRVSRLNIVRAIRDTPDPSTAEPSRAVVGVGGLVALGGAALIAWGWFEDTGLGKIPGPPVLALGLGIVAASRGFGRAGLSLACAFGIGWLLAPFGLVSPSDNVSVAFVMTGIILVGSAILIAVLNVSEITRFVLRRASREIGRPVLRTAVSYPMEKRFRTGMTIAMFALIMFMITLISMVQGLEQSSLGQFVSQQSGGYDIVGYTTTYGEIPNFRQILETNFTQDDFLGGWSGVASASVLPATVKDLGRNVSVSYTLWGVDNFLIQSNQYGFLSNLPYVVNDTTGARVNLTTREDVWRSLQQNHSLAIVDRGAAGGNQFVSTPTGLDLVPGDAIRVLDRAGNAVNLTIVGVLDQALQFTSGVFVDRSVVAAHFPVAETFTAYFFQVAPGVAVSALRAQLERVFFAYGLQPIDIREQIGQAFDASQEVLTLLQAYLGIGLSVGVAGLAVVTLRAVVERRTQIGTLRAIGFTRRMVLRVFLVEIALIAVLGIAIGVGLGIVFAYKVYLVYFADIVTFGVPWTNLAIIVAIASAAAIASTAQPAIRASRIPPAEALRYSE